MSLFSVYNGAKTSLVTRDWLIEQGFRKIWNPVTRKVDYYKDISIGTHEGSPFYMWVNNISIHLSYNTTESCCIASLEGLHNEIYQYTSAPIKTRLQFSMLVDNIMQNYKDLYKGIINPVWIKKRVMK